MMQSVTRRHLLELGGGAAALLLPGASLAATDPAKLEQLVFAGPPAPPSIYLAHMAENPALKRFAKTTSFKQWRSPDMLISQVMNRDIHVGGTPSNVAAMLYNKGAGIRLLDITTWGVLWLVTRDPAIKSFGDIKGKELLSFFRGGMPDITLRYLAKKQGLEAGTDFKVNYASNPLQTMKLFMAGKAQTAILPEPAATAAEIKSRLTGKPVTRIDLQQVWGEVTGRAARIPQAGTLIQEKLALERPDILAAVKQAGIDGVAMMNDDPAQSAAIGVKAFGLNTPIITKAMKNVTMKRLSGADAREELEFFYRALMELSPKLVGGKLPDDAFYLD